jgi:transposase-like protein
MTLNLKDKIYNDENAAREHLEAIQWPDGPICPHCGVVDEATLLKGKSTRPGVWKCRACEKPFSVTVGTVFERSKIPLTKWLLATELLTSSKKGISAHQLHRMLGITYKSAWFMAHRIREAMAPAKGSEPPLGGQGKIVEADETYLLKSHEKVTKKSGGYAHKMKVVSLVERGGRIVSKRIKDGTKLEISDIIRENVHRESILHTDGAGVYKNLGWTKKHEAVDHNTQYVRPGKNGRKVHTNTLEGFFSVFKRGMVGTYQHCGEQHLDRYLAEFDFRANNRTALGVDDTARAIKALAGIKGKRLTYRRIDKTSDGQAAIA